MAGGSTPTLSQNHVHLPVQDSETVPGTEANNNSALMYHVEARCSALPFPYYSMTRQKSCPVLCAPSRVEDHRSSGTL